MVLKRSEKKLAKASAVESEKIVLAPLMAATEAEIAVETVAEIGADLGPAAAVDSVVATRDLLAVDSVEERIVHLMAAETEAAIAAGLDLAAVAAADSEAETTEDHVLSATDHLAADRLAIGQAVAAAVDSEAETTGHLMATDQRSVIEAVREIDRHSVTEATIAVGTVVVTEAATGAEIEMVAAGLHLVTATTVATDQAMVETDRSRLAIGRSLHLAVAQNEDLEVGE